MYLKYKKKNNFKIKKKTLLNGKQSFKLILVLLPFLLILFFKKQKNLRFNSKKNKNLKRKYFAILQFKN